MTIDNQIIPCDRCGIDFRHDLGEPGLVCGPCLTDAEYEARFAQMELSGTKALTDIILRVLARYEADAASSSSDHDFVAGIRCELRGLGVGTS